MSMGGCQAAAGIPAGPVHTIGEALTHPQTLARGMVVETRHTTAGPNQAIGCPVHFSATPAAVTRAAPQLGEHTRELLAGYGYSEADIDRYLADGVVVIDLKADDDIICDWYKLTKPAQPTVTATATVAATSTPKTGGVTELPATGVAGGDGDGSTAAVIGAATVAGAAALIVGRKLIASRENPAE